MIALRKWENNLNSEYTGTSTNSYLYTTATSL